MCIIDMHLRQFWASEVLKGAEAPVPDSSAICMSLAVGLNFTRMGLKACWKPASCRCQQDTVHL